MTSGTNYRSKITGHELGNRDMSDGQGRQLKADCKKYMDMENDRRETWEI